MHGEISNTPISISYSKTYFCFSKEYNVIYHLLNHVLI